MPRNVEIKARVNDLAALTTLVKNLCQTEGVVLVQEDIFFDSPKGRLKLRNFQDGTKSQLIFYDRPNIKSPKLSTYSICSIDNPHDLLIVLTSALGCLGTIKKTRQLFIYEQTRIHLDKIQSLGEFVELEVVLSAQQSVEEGANTAKKVLKLLNIGEDNLIQEAYIDLVANI